MTTEYMTSRERVVATFKKQDRDRSPLINPTSIVNVECMAKAKVYFPSAHHDSAKMAVLASTGYELLKFDSIAPCFSVCNEAEALGCSINWGKVDIHPDIISPAFKSFSDFKIPKNFLDKKPVRTVIDAIKLIKKKYGNDAAIIGKVMGPWTLSFNLIGIQNMLNSLIMEPDTVKSFIEELNEVAILFAEAQIKAGADIITISDDAVGDFISVEGYNKIILPIHKYLNNKIGQNAFTILHISGIILDKMETFTKAGFNALNFDSRNTAHKTILEVKNKILLAGCINNPYTLLNGNEEDVIREVIYCIENKIDFIAPECAIPCNVTSKNLLAMSKAIKQYYN